MSSELRRRPNAASTSAEASGDAADKKSGGGGGGFFGIGGNNNNDGGNNNNEGGGGGGFFGLFQPKPGPAGKSTSRSLIPEPSAPPKPELNLRILIEIVSAENLAKPNPNAADGGAGFPYVTLKMNNTMIHKTRPASGKGLSPIYTVKSSSLYLLCVNDEEFENGPGLTFEVLTGGILGPLLEFSHGVVRVMPGVVMAGTGERMEFELADSSSAADAADGTAAAGDDAADPAAATDAGAAAEDGAADGDAEKEEEEDSVTKRGTLALRFRRATDDDIKFMTAVQPYNMLSASALLASAGDNKDAAEAAASEAALFAGGPADFNFKQDRPPRGYRQKRKGKSPTNKSNKDRSVVDRSGSSFFGKAEGEEELLRVQPRPDPDDTEGTTWLSTSDIDATAVQPSKHWVQAGKGAFGTLHVEVIKCDGLPNMDVAGVTGDRTDAFAALLFEDTLVRTDVIFDCLSPRWMPWSQRAFSFPVKHPTSPLVLGVFDYDAGGAMNFHDAIGRVVINMSSFECDTVYLLSYTLHSSPTKDDNFGTITVRLRLDYNDEKQALMESFTKPPRYHVNVDSAKAYDVLKYLCKGQVHMDKASTQTISLYGWELLSYFEYYLYVIDFLLMVLLWRGKVKVAIPVPRWLITIQDEKTTTEAVGATASKEEEATTTAEEETNESKDESLEDSNIVECLIWFPIHSIFFFFAITLTIEHPGFIPATFFLGVAWIMGTIGFQRSHHPYVWERCKSITEFSSVLALGRNVHKPVSIDPNVGVEEAATLKAINEAKTQRAITGLMAFKTAGLTFYRNYYKTDSESLAIETEDKEWSLFGAQLYYAHMALSYMCIYARALVNVLTWRSCSTSYFLTMRCFFFGVASLFIPWGFVLQWSARILAWTLLGPWMKLFDIYFVKDYYRTREELAENPEIVEPDVESLFQDAKYSELAKKVRIAGEDAVKLKDMREYRFGKFSARIPAFDESRFPSVPLPQSTARPFDAAGAQEAAYQYLPEDDCEVVFVPGQRLRGTMVHKAEDLNDGNGGDAPKESSEE